MLRAFCLGILAISAAGACKKTADAPAVAPNAAAGTVVAVSGSVEATRAGTTRQLAVGTEVFADDEVKTGADATVEIELFHNHAKWSLTANKQGRVDGSLAWGMAKQEASKAIEHNTAAAGREAERAAAETAATAAETRMKEAPDVQAAREGAKQEAPAMGAPPAQTVAPGRAAANEPTAGAPAPLPPPPDEPRANHARDDAPMPTREIAGDGKLPPSKGRSVPESAEAKSVASPQVEANTHKAELAKCFPASTAATITIDVRANTPSTSITGPRTVTAKQRACVAGVVKAIEWPVKGATFRVKVELD